MNSRAIRSASVCIICVLFVMICSAQASADDAATSQLAIKQSEVDLLKSQIETLKNAAQFNPVEGKAEIGDSVSIEVEVLAQRRLRAVANKIIERIYPKIPETAPLVLVDGSADVQSIIEYKVIKKSLETLNKDYDAYKPYFDANRDLRSSSLVAGAAILSFASLFRTDVSLKGAKVTVDPMTLHTELARAVICKPRNTIKIIDPSVFTSLQIGDDSEIETNFEEARGKRTKADQWIKDHENTQQTDEKKVLENLKILNARFDGLATQLLTAGGQPGANPLVSILRAEKLYKLTSKSANAAPAKILITKLILGGGNNRSRRNILFTSIDHSGGVVVSFTLLDADGYVEMAETFYDYEGYVKGEKIAEKGLGSNLNSPEYCK